MIAGRSPWSRAARASVCGKVRTGVGGIGC
jgi:hypothetical protein